MTRKNNKKPTSKTPRWPLLILYILGLLIALSSALPAYIQSNYLKEIVSLQGVSLFFIVANLATVIIMSVFPKIIRSLSNYFTTKMVLVIYAASLLSLTMARTPGAALISIALFTITSNLIWINLDLLVEKFSSDASTGRTRTIYFTFINAGWILAPSISSYLVKIGTYDLTFFISACLVIPIFLILLSYGRRLGGKTEYRAENVWLAAKKMWHNHNLRGIFLVAILLQLFYSLAVVYIPLYLHQTLGMDWKIIGPIFSIMLIPFVIFEIPAGIIADRYLGEKEILNLGLFILVLSLLLFFYIDKPIAWIWAVVLFLSRVGASLVEAMRETYFFKQVDAKDVSYINLFRLSAPIGYIIGPILAIIILFFWPINYIFLVAAAIMMSGFIFVNNLKDTK